jgi:4-hydroxy-3-methylbut-2-enyl diphosphate reductase
VPAQANARGLDWLDATCPLVSKVHIETERHFDQKRHVLLIGHAAHPEVIGTMGQVPEGAITLIESEADAMRVTPPEGALAYATQTTLSVSDTADIIAILQRRFPDIAAPHKEDICYATTNRQQAVEDLAQVAEAVFVIGAPNSSNSQRLVEVAQTAGCQHAELIAQAEDIPWDRINGLAHIGLTAGASAPEEIIQEVIAAFRERYDLDLQVLDGVEENVHFKLPKALRDV